MASEFGFEFSEFNELIQQFENLGVGDDEIAKVVLDSVEDDAIQAFAANIPKSDLDKEHAADNVIASKTRKSRHGSRYRVVGAADRGKMGGMNWDRFRYLFYVENGTSNMVAKPFINKAHKAVRDKVQPKMKTILENELAKRLGG